MIKAFSSVRSSLTFLQLYRELVKLDDNLLLSLTGPMSLQEIFRVG